MRQMLIVLLLIYSTTGVAAEQCRRLIDAGITEFHFYTLNQAEPTLKLWRNLGLPG